MSKLLCLGMPLTEVIAATTQRPAAALRRPDLGTLAPGAAGDATILDLAEGSFDYLDVMGERLQGERRFAVEAMVVAGRVWPASDTAG
jgi:dihydroorotase